MSVACAPCCCIFSPRLLVDVYPKTRRSPPLLARDGNDATSIMTRVTGPFVPVQTASPAPSSLLPNLSVDEVRQFDPHRWELRCGKGREYPRHV